MRTSPGGLCIQGEWQGRLKCPSEETGEGTFQKPRQEPEEGMVRGVDITNRSPVGGPEEWPLKGDKVRLEVTARQGQ